MAGVAERESQIRRAHARHRSAQVASIARAFDGLDTTTSGEQPASIA